MIKINALYEDGVRELPFKSWKFPAGESGVKFEEDISKLTDFAILWEYENDSEIMLIAQISNALRQNTEAYISLMMPYLPYSRQDRVCHAGEAFSLKVFAGIINSLKFESVGTLDVHNESVYFELFDNSFNIPQNICASMLPKYDYLIAPDAGAAKKIYMHRQVNYEENPTKIIVMDKTRVDGKVVYNAQTGIPAGSKVCVVDDLCDGGATFLALCDAINYADLDIVDLYVTHGLFTNIDSFTKMYITYDTIYVKNLVNKTVKRKVKEI